MTYTSKATAAAPTTVTIQHPPPAGAVNQVHNVAAGTIVVQSPEGVVTILEP